jgi:hypothetical protein
MTTCHALRRRILDRVDHNHDRRERLSDSAVALNKKGELRKTELEPILDALGVPDVRMSGTHKRAWRSYIRDECDIDYDGMGWSRFKKRDLFAIDRELRNRGFER